VHIRQVQSLSIYHAHISTHSYAGIGTVVAGGARFRNVIANFKGIFVLVTVKVTLIPAVYSCFSSQLFFALFFSLIDWLIDSFIHSFFHSSIRLFIQITSHKNSTGRI